MANEIPQLVGVEWLAANHTDPNIRVVDVRWYLTEPDRGRSEYLAGHIPGAAFMDMEADLSSPRGQGPGRHPLPTPEAFAAAAGRAGIGPDTYVIAYDSSGGGAAARLWWLLHYFGHPRVSLLDGGWQAWQLAGYTIEASVPAIPPALFTPAPRPEMVVDAAAVEVLRSDPHVLLLDARATERYEGRVEPIDARAGHIPGAKSAPFAGNIAPDGKMRTAEELRERFQALGAGTAQQIVCYCGSGVTAAHNIFAMQLAGHNGILLYEGSW